MYVRRDHVAKRHHTTPHSPSTGHVIKRSLCWRPPFHCKGAGNPESLLREQKCFRCRLDCLRHIRKRRWRESLDRPICDIAARAAHSRTIYQANLPRLRRRTRRHQAKSKRHSSCWMVSRQRSSVVRGGQAAACGCLAKCKRKHEFSNHRYFSTEHRFSA